MTREHISTDANPTPRAPEPLFSHRFPGTTSTAPASSNMSAHLFFLSNVMGLALGIPVEGWQPPLGNLSALQEDVAPSWVSRSTRGTFEILYSCGFALGLCVYTALHLNVPPPQERERYICLRKAKWALVALFVPEVVLYAAWRQWCDAIYLCKKINKIQVPVNEKPDTHTTVHRYDDIVGTPYQILRQR